MLRHFSFRLAQPAGATVDELVLGRDAMGENNYPFEGKPESEGFIQIAENPAASHKLLAIDCEMVTTQHGLELARVSLVNSEMEVIYDTFVMPDERILDYNTKFSGVTYESLQGVTTKLRDVQQHLATLLSPDTVLVGHSLENDLKALRLIHMSVIDTALIFSHLRGPPYKPALKWLCEKFLGKEIQGKESGHDSIEDARSAMELVNLKLKNGAEFGLMNQDNIRLSVKLEHNGRTSAIVDTKNIAGTFGQAPAESKICNSDDDVVAGLVQFGRTKHFVFGRFTALESFYSAVSSPLHYSSKRGF